MSKTDFLGLTLTAANEVEMTFLQWRTLMNGVNVDSNMELIDAAIKSLDTKTGGRADGISFDTETGMLRLTSNGKPLPGASVLLGITDFYTKDEVDDKVKEAERNAEVHIEYDSSTNQLQLVDGEGNPIDDPIELNGGGSGPSSYTYTITLINTLDTRTITAAANADVLLKFNYSTDDGNGNDDGAGVGTILVGNVRKANFSAVQGENTINIKDYLTTGSNTVKVKIEDTEGAYKTLTYTVDVISLSISTTFEGLGTYQGDVLFNYTVIGSGDKTVHFVMDGTQIGTETVTSTGRSRTTIIHAQSHGGHTLEVYATVENGGVSVRSNTITLGMIWVSSGSVVPAIATAFDMATCEQGEALTIPYMVYDPLSETTTVTLSVIAEDGSVYSSKSVSADRLSQSWAISDYPLGDIKFRIACGETYEDLPVTVTESTFDIEPVQDGLILEFNATGRNNGEDNPATWHYEDITATFDGFGWTDADGWHNDANGETCLRFLPGETMVIPYQLFATDIRSTGATIEVDLATRDVRDYDSIVLTCMNGGRGFNIASQYAEVKSEQTAISMQFKEDSRIHITISIEQNNINRFVYIYINGIMCGVAQYATNDNFQQPNPVSLTIGANTCGIDLYKVRYYAKGLNRAEVLDNFICDQPTLRQRIDAYNRNDILDTSEEVTISKLPNTLPYMLVECAELPQYKGDKKTNVRVSYTDPSDSSKNWTADGVEMDVQGTSSAGYPVKNYKIKLKNGITYTISGETERGAVIHPGSMPTKTLCMKADFASSENANNVLLADYYNELVPYKTPPQVENPLVRQGIEGIPTVMFWQNTSTNAVSFVGKYNENTDKGNEDIFGFTSAYPNAESWEFKNNTSNRTLFLTSNYTGNDWLNDFEARYPEDNTNYTRLKRVTDWVVSTARRDTDSEETKAAKLQKFKDEFENYFIKSEILFYYLFTETFLMVDSRAKNMFLTTYDGTHWFSLPYDFDTAIGINNEGVLAFDYDLEDTDTVGGENVFNGQKSALWNNVRDAFGDEIKAMYADLRSAGTFSYGVIKNRFEAHQGAWPEALWNEDAFIKYLQPYLLKNENYLSMLQGNKASQREWWLFNGFRYRDSKYQCGDASNEFITLRCYAVGDITVTPYSHIWPRVKYGSYTATCRGKRNQSYVMECGLDEMNDTETYIYSADRIASVGNLSHLMVGYANFAAATKLQSILLGSHESGYVNTRLTELYVGNNELLTTVNVENCTSLTMPIDLSGCASIESVYAKGSAITGVQLPNGGHLERLELPATITNLTIQNQKDFEELDMTGYSAITTLRIENTPNVPIEDIVSGAVNLDRVRMIGVDWTSSDNETLAAVIDRLATCHGMTASGETISEAGSAVVSGIVRVQSISGTLLNKIVTLFPNLIVIVNGQANFVMHYYDWDGTELYIDAIPEGSNATDPVATGTIDAPTRAGSDTLHYDYGGWNALPTNVHGNANIIAQYTKSFRIRYLNWDDSVLQSGFITQGNDAAYTGSTPTRAATAQYTFAFSRWNGTETNIQDSHDITAVFTETLRKYTVRFININTTLQTVTNVAYGSSATYTGSTPVHPTNPQEMTFTDWSPTGQNITGDTDCYAQYFDTTSPLLKYIKSEITTYESEDATVLAHDAFYIMSTLTSARTSATTIGECAFYGCSNLQTVDFIGNGAGSIAANAFNSCNKLTDIFIRSSSVWSLASTNALPTTPFTSGTACIYVPAALVDAYKAATNWSAFANRIFPIDAYPVTDFSTISDTWAEILAAEEDGSYANKYKVGDTKLLEMGTQKVYMQIVAMDADELTAGGNAKITWLIKDCWPATTHRMNASNVTTDGWLATEMRSWLRSDILPLIPETVRNAIKTVNKTYKDYGTRSTKTCEDTIWIPSSREIFGDTTYEGSGAVYTSLFKDAASRIKYYNGSVSNWWLRSANSATYFRIVISNGTANTNYAGGSYGVVFGFCT